MDHVISHVANSLLNLKNVRFFAFNGEKHGKTEPYFLHKG